MSARLHSRRAPEAAAQIDAACTSGLQQLLLLEGLKRLTRTARRVAETASPVTVGRAVVVKL